MRWTKPSLFGHCGRVKSIMHSIEVFSFQSKSGTPGTYGDTFPWRVSVKIRTKEPGEEMPDTFSRELWLSCILRRFQPANSRKKAVSASWTANGASSTSLPEALVSTSLSRQPTRLYPNTKSRCIFPSH